MSQASDHPTWYQVVSKYWTCTKNLNLTNDLKSETIRATVHCNVSTSASTFNALLGQIVYLYNNNPLVADFLRDVHERLEKQTLPSYFDLRCTASQVNKENTKIIHCFRFRQRLDRNLLRGLLEYLDYSFEYYQLSDPSSKCISSSSLGRVEEETNLPDEFDCLQFFKTYV